MKENGPIIKLILMISFTLSEENSNSHCQKKSPNHDLCITLEVSNFRNTFQVSDCNRACNTNMETELLGCWA